ncbi:MAG: DUF5777 family beta-barrel protein [Crocinitomicaceae bacterium]
MTPCATARLIEDNLNFTNSGGLGETQFIPYTLEKISNGQFRFGFCVGRKFIINE